MRTKTIIASAIAVLQIALAFGQDISEKAQYSFSKATILKIDNSFGDVNVNTYSGNSIDISVEIVLDLKNPDDKQKVLDKISIRTSESNNMVSVTTENKINGMRTVRSFQINYTVKLPQGVALEVANQFGDVVVGDVKENLKLKVQHGSCTVNSATGKSTQLNVQFGDLRFENATNASIDIQHGDFHGGKIGNLNINHMFGKSKIRQLTGVNKVKLQHGEFSVEKLEPGLKELDINAQFSTISLGNITGSSYRISLDGNFSNFSWDKVLKSSKGGITIISELKELHRNKVELASDGQTDAANKIIINASHSDVQLY